MGERREKAKVLAKWLVEEAPNIRRELAQFSPRLGAAQDQLEKMEAGALVGMAIAVAILYPDVMDEAMEEVG